MHAALHAGRHSPCPPNSVIATLALLLVTAAPAPAAIVVNEAESSAIFDYIELTNTGAAPVDISGYILKDNNNNRTLAVPAGTTLAAGGYYVHARRRSGPGATSGSAKPTRRGCSRPATP